MDKGPAQALSGKQRVLVKPNFVVTQIPLAATHTDAMRAVLDFVRAHYDGPVTIAEGPSVQPAAEAFQRYDCGALAKAYDASLLDLNLDEPFPVKIYDRRLRPLRLDMACSVVDSDFRILLAPLVVPHLAVIDGFEAMEGNGPSNGTLVPLRLAVASTDALAADTVGTALMGFDVDQVGYLHYCERMNLGTDDLQRIDIVGNADLADCVRPFRPHHAIGRQRRWQLPQADRYLFPQEAGT